MIEMVRVAYMPDHTLGWLTVGDLRLATIERPWIPSPDHAGGLNAQSCVPDGAYDLHHHAGPRFPHSFALEAPSLHVWRWLPPGRAGRSAILIHVGNWVRDVIGCIAVGLAHVRMEGLPAVSSSSIAMARLRQALSGAPLPQLLIRPTRGTSERA